MSSITENTWIVLSPMLTNTASTSGTFDHGSFSSKSIGMSGGSGKGSLPGSMAIASDCGVSLPNESLSSEGLYD
jgi:hypothetical protein